MKYSIIIPVYNVEKTLDKCLQSVQNQTFKDFEVIMINDGSSDLSGEICFWIVMMNIPSFILRPLKN